MKIVFQHDHPLPVKTYGGTERIMFWHMQELARLGHEVLLIGHPNSRLSGTDIKLIPMSDKNWHHLVPQDSDIIHLNYNHEYPGSIPTINTLHGNGKMGEIFTPNTVFVSRKHGENHGGKVFIYNAFNMDEYPAPNEFNKNLWNNFLFLGKASWKVKNLKHCLKATHRNKCHLEVAGGSSFIPRRRAHFHGFVSNVEKVSLMQKCHGLLMPVRWHEPFGMVVIESMTQGLPVIASPFGSLPELINEENGLIVHNYREFEEALKERPKNFNPKQIRAYALANYSIATYSKKYLELYEKVIAGEKLHHEKLTWQYDFPPQKLLEF